MDLSRIRKSAEKDIKSAKDLKVLELIRVKYVGRKGQLTKVLRGLKNVKLSERRRIGSIANKTKKEIEAFLAQKIKTFSKTSPIGSHRLDITKPGAKIEIGHLHPLDSLSKEIRKIFSDMNFSIIDGPEIETEYYNFDALNIPPDHPARDMWDTLWIKMPDKKTKAHKEKLLLRTHTSPVQIRYMEENKPPFQIIVPGRVFRHEATDSSHEVNFYQIEGLMVGKDVSLTNLKFIIEHFFKRLFGQRLKMRFRPSYFPFVEPGLEVDIKMGNKWLEVMGAGMVHPHVFEYAHYNPLGLQGFAFGAGLDRLAMIKYGIPDIRLFYSGDLRFIKQF